MNKKLIYLIIIIFIITIISYIRIIPKFHLIQDQFAFWGCTGDLWVEVNGIYDNKGIPDIDPKYSRFSDIFYPVKFGYPPVWITFLAFLRSVTLLPSWVIGKIFVYLLGIVGSFTLFSSIQK